MTTYARQGELPKLPIPPLETTLAKYLETLRPLQNNAEHEATIAAVARFADSGTATLLNNKLLEYLELQNLYIEQFWYELYLNYDSPVVLNLNPFFLLEDDPRPVYHLLQVRRAASIVLLSLHFIRDLKREELPVDTVPRLGKPLCMNQYRTMFGLLRIPTLNTELGCFIAHDPSSTHIVVLSRLQFYWFDVLDTSHDLVLTENDLAANFQAIVDDSKQALPEQVAQNAIGVLTTENRRVWARLRTHLSSTEAGAATLSKIDTALFVLVLDDSLPELLLDLAENMLCGRSVLERGVQVGTCTNRWYDKLQIIVTENARVGINFEHTGVDGHTVLRFVLDIYTDLILLFARQINGALPSVWRLELPDPRLRSKELLAAYVRSPTKLEWPAATLALGEVLLLLRFGETRLLDLIMQNEFLTLEFKHYGLNTIKKSKFSPDAFIQMAFQATYYALYGKVECTYEPAMTKMFLHGRTEAIRSVSQELNTFVRRFFSLEVSASDKVADLRAACTKHSASTRDGLQGLGVDRHLYALYCIWSKFYLAAEMRRTNSDDTLAESLELPLIFADRGWERLNTTIILTLNCGNPLLRLFGFGPVSANGFGIGYILKDESITICVSSKHRQTPRFLATLENYLLEVKGVLEEAVAAAAVAAAAEALAEEESRLRLSRHVAELREKNTRYLNRMLGGYGYFDVGDDAVKLRGVSPERNGTPSPATTPGVGDLAKRLEQLERLSRSTSRVHVLQSES